MRNSDEAGAPLLPSGSDTMGRGGRLAPPEHASAKEVQEHIMRMLHHVCDLPTAAAVNIAAQWTMGTGQDLLSCDADACRAIFGAEAGSIIYHRSRRDRLVARHGEGRLGTMEGIYIPRCRAQALRFATSTDADLSFLFLVVIMALFGLVIILAGQYLAISAAKCSGQ